MGKKKQKSALSKQDAKAAKHALKDQKRLEVVAAPINTRRVNRKLLKPHLSKLLKRLRLLSRQVLIQTRLQIPVQALLRVNPKKLIRRKRLKQSLQTLKTSPTIWPV